MRYTNPGTLIGAVAVAILTLNAPGNAHANPQVIDQATVGSCLHGDSQPAPGGGSLTAFSAATCGTPYANLRVESVVSDKTACGDLWAVFGMKPNRYVCLADI